jgi:hypothetical protein
MLLLSDFAAIIIGIELVFYPVRRWLYLLNSAMSHDLREASALPIMLWVLVLFILTAVRVDGRPLALWRIAATGGTAGALALAGSNSGVVGAVVIVLSATTGVLLCWWFRRLLAKLLKAQGALVVRITTDFGHTLTLAPSAPIAIFSLATWLASAVALWFIAATVAQRIADIAFLLLGMVVAIEFMAYRSYARGTSRGQSDDGHHSRSHSPTQSDQPSESRHMRIESS